MHLRQLLENIFLELTWSCPNQQCWF